MSDEEKKALEILNNTEWDGFMITIKNLIEKQFKEIQELKENQCVYKDTSSCTKSISLKTYAELNNYISKKESEQKERKAYIDGTNVAHELCNKKWEDKIKAKIEYYEKIDNPVGKRVLESLLEKE